MNKRRESNAPDFNVAAVSVRPAALEPLLEELAQAGARVELDRSGGSSLLSTRRCPIVAIVHAPDGEVEEALVLVRRLHRRHPRLVIVLVVERSSESLAIRAIKAGARDYIRVSDPTPAAVRSICEAARMEFTPPTDRRPATSGEGPPFVGGSAAVQGVLTRVRSVAPTDSTVLIVGETGTGKELIARLIHAQSSRRNRSLVTINCAAVPSGLFESEFFGHERGAFTGAIARHEGAFERADSGTLVLDEIGEMSLAAQAKLLRAIEGRQILRIGGAAPVSVDVRLVASTNRPLERLVQEGTFRADLFYRLNVVSIEVPPLRERKEDLSDLAKHHLRKIASRLGRPESAIAPDALGVLLRHDWPGNVRELQNLLESVVVTNGAGEISLDDLPPRFRDRLQQVGACPQTEREQLIAALTASNGNKSLAARSLECSRMTLYRRLARHNLLPSPSDPASPVGRSH